MITPRLASFVLALGISACGSGSDEDPTFAVRDSAGVEIVESRAAAWTPGAEFEIGGDPEGDLFRLSSPQMLPDGRLIVYDGGSCSLRVYDSSQQPTSSFGRCGEGPGEFTGFRGVWNWRGDSLLVVDQAPTRYALFDRDGVLARTGRVPPDPSLPAPFVAGVLEGGTFVLRGYRDPAGRTSPGIAVGTLQVALARPDEGSWQLLGSYPGATWETIALDENGALGRQQLPFTGSALVVTDATTVFVGLPDRFEIQSYDETGTLTRVLRRTFDPVPVEPVDLEHLLNRRLAQVDGEAAQRAVRQAYRDLNHAETMPPFGIPRWPGGAEGGPGMLVDDTGSLWVFNHYRPGAFENRWTVFSPAGVWLGTVALPERLRPSHIGDDFVLGRWEDDLGFRRVARYRLTKPDQAP